MNLQTLHAILDELDKARALTRAANEAYQKSKKHTPESDAAYRAFKRAEAVSSVALEQAREVARATLGIPKA
jgi:hypothetical protein